jgi:hypothetical protein
LLRNNHLGLAAQVAVNPAFTRGGPELKLEPIAFFDMTLRANGTWYYGSFFTPLPEPTTAATADYRRSHRDEAVGAGELRLDTNARLKLKVWKIIAVGDMEARYRVLRPFTGTFEWYWDSSEMINLPTEGLSYTSSQMVVGIIHQGEGDEKLWIGAMGNWNGCRETKEDAWRAGPLIWWKPTPSPSVPDLVLGSQVWWKSRFHEPLGPYTFLALRWDSGS